MDIVGVVIGIVDKDVGDSLVSVGKSVIVDSGRLDGIGAHPSNTIRSVMNANSLIFILYTYLINIDNKETTRSESPLSLTYSTSQPTPETPSSSDYPAGH